MTRFMLFAALALWPFAAIAQEAGADAPADPAAEEQPAGFQPIVADGVNLDDFLWRNRVVVVFAQSEFDPAFGEQMRNFEARWPEMEERDVVVITDTDPAAMSSVRQKLRPRGFQLVLISKDGVVVLRKPFPWDVRELSRAIDKLPLRQEEIRLKRSGLQ
ncbi:DUF4174 domain-containing protein [Ostreiculturibacter nitratireducens]|uniref:DUF4174 domain-containing protein n=1 Tax=Ostreiculturibacter nitratireducens TaxID=3075226 RepID=UPI0031B642AC